MANKQNKVARFTAELWAKPHLVSTEGFKQISDYLEDRNSGALLKIDAEDIEQKRDVSYDTNTKVGVIKVEGTLTYKPVFSLSGTTGVSYQELLETTEEMIDSGVKTIVMQFNSGGGEAYSTFTTANEIRKMADDAGVKIYGYVDGRAASAAYALACICDELYAHPQAEVGSIGVLCALTNNSKQLENEGISRVFVTAGKEKIPFAEDGSFKQSFLDDLQAKIDVLFGQFVNHVSLHTGLTEQQVRNTEAKTFLSNEAQALGLIDGIMTQSEFVQYVADNKGA